MSNNEVPKPKVVLVVGDWYVEEHWVVARDRSITASRKGESHYHVLHEHDACAESLCGAGIDASLLKAVVDKNQERRFDVHGLGAWHENDGGQLERMLKFEDLTSWNRFRETGPSESKPQCLHNLKELRETLANELTTTRIIRVYFQDGDKTRLIQRIDWEEPPKSTAASGRSYWIKNQEKGKNDDIKELVAKLPPIEPDAIVVRDHVKGVVSPTLIRALIEKYGNNPKPKWYIYSKDWHLEREGGDEKWRFREDSWVSKLLEEKQNVQLFFVPRVAAQSAMYEPYRHVNNWRVARRRPSWRAMKVMDALANGLESPDDKDTRGNQTGPGSSTNEENISNNEGGASTDSDGSKRVPWIIVMPEDTLVFARAPDPMKKDGQSKQEEVQSVENKLLIAWSDRQEPEEIGVPRGSMLFASLVACMLQADSENAGSGGTPTDDGEAKDPPSKESDADPVPGAAVKESGEPAKCVQKTQNTGKVKGQEAASLLRRAIAFTDKWAEDESGRIREPEDWIPKGLSDLWGAPNTTPTKYGIDSSSWEKTKEGWEQARTKDEVPITGRTDEQEETDEQNERDEQEKGRIELWRAMTDVDGYICLAENKRRTIRSIKRQLAQFRGSPDRHVSMMLEADPGSGKSTLLDNLAREAGMQLMSFNITQMVSPAEILDCFDAIVSRQASTENSKPILVFFDEINATIANDDAYGKFLDPIDRGTYTRRGRTFSIRPCVWVFARTKDKKDRPKMKHSDFLSRLTLRPLNFSTLPGDENADLERRYLGAALLQAAFPEVQYSCDLVLQSFDLLFDRSLRGCEKFVRKFRNIRQGHVRADNVPIEWIRESWRDVFDSAGEQNAGEVELVYPPNDEWEVLLGNWNEQRGKLAKPEDLLKTPFRYDWFPMLKKWKQEAERQTGARKIKIIRRPDRLKDNQGTQPSA